MLYGDGGAGKSTLGFTSPSTWPPAPVPRDHASTARRVCSSRTKAHGRCTGQARPKLEGWLGSAAQRPSPHLGGTMGKGRFVAASWRKRSPKGRRQQDRRVIPGRHPARHGRGRHLQEVRDFMCLVEQVRELAERPCRPAHPPRKPGRPGLSGAWEGAGDTLLHVPGAGPRKLRLHVQKARRRHAPDTRQTLNLTWTDGEGFEVEEGPNSTTTRSPTRSSPRSAPNPGNGVDEGRGGDPGHGPSAAKRRSRRPLCTRADRQRRQGQDGPRSALDLHPGAETAPPLPRRRPHRRPSAPGPGSRRGADLRLARAGGRRASAPCSPPYKGAGREGASFTALRYIFPGIQRDTAGRRTTRDTGTRCSPARICASSASSGAPSTPSSAPSR